MIRKVYAFDVDECLECSNGPVPVASMLQLKQQGHIVGLCGNGRKFVNSVPDWWEYISFTLNLDLGPFVGFQGLIHKACWLSCFKDMYPLADQYIMVGNRYGRTNKLGHVCGSNDEEAAKMAGWDFILEDSFADGDR